MDIGQQFPDIYKKFAYAHDRDGQMSYLRGYQRHLETSHHVEHPDVLTQMLSPEGQYDAAAQAIGATSWHPDVIHHYVTNVLPQSPSKARNIEDTLHDMYDVARNREATPETLKHLSGVMDNYEGVTHHNSETTEYWAGLLNKARRNLSKNPNWTNENAKSDE